MADRARLDDAAVRERLSGLDGALGALEADPGAGSALDAIAVLLEVYGEALARVVDHGDAATARALADDELVGHLLALHGLRAEPTAEHRPTAARTRGPAFIPIEELARSVGGGVR